MKKSASFGLLLTLGLLFGTSIEAQEVSDVGTEVQAVRELVDEFSESGAAPELEIAIKKAAALRESWEAQGRPEPQLERVRLRKIDLRGQIANEAKSRPVEVDPAMEAAFASTVKPYVREFNGSTLAKGEVVITFDDGPHPKLTPLIHSYVKSLKIPAAFFEIGENVKNNIAQTSSLASDGFVIGNHSWDHPDLTKKTDAQVAQEINDTSKEIQVALGGADQFEGYFSEFFAKFFNEPKKVYFPEFFRSPYGSRSARTMNIISNTVIGEADPVINGKPVMEVQMLNHILWNVDSLDWQDPNPATIEKRVFDELATYGHHGIILFHDIHPQTVTAVQSILPRLIREGYKLVSLYDMIAEVEKKDENFLNKP